MKYLLSLSLLLSTGLALRAEQLWVGTLETDSLQSLQLSISAFTRNASLPGQADEQTALLQQLFSLPTLDFIDEGAPLRVFWVADNTRPLGAEGNPAAISVLPLKRDNKPLDFFLFKAYKSKRTLMGVTTYTIPVATNTPEWVVVHEAKRTMTLAPSRALFDWFQSQQSALPAYLPRQTSETLRLKINPRLIAELLPLKKEHTAYALMANSLESTALGIKPEGRGCTITLYLQPKADSTLAAILKDMPAPKPELWHAIPGNALFSMLYTEPGKTQWSAYLNQSATNAFSTIFADLQPFLGRERLLYLVPTRSRDGMSFVQIAPVLDATATREAIKHLSTRTNNVGFRLMHEQTRHAVTQTFERYTLTYQPATPVVTTNAPTDASSFSLGTVMPLFLRNALLEVTVKEGYLFAIASSANAIEQECPECPFPVQRLTLKQRLAAYSSSPNIIAAGDLCILGFLRQLVSMLASSDLQSKKIFSEVTDGFQFWVTRETDNSSTLSLRLAANEIASLQKAFSEDREALQDIFFTLFTKQIKPVNEAPQQQP